MKANFNIKKRNSENLNNLENTDIKYDEVDFD